MIDRGIRSRCVSLKISSITSQCFTDQEDRHISNSFQREFVPRSSLRYSLRINTVQETNLLCNRYQYDCSVAVSTRFFRNFFNKRNYASL